LCLDLLLELELRSTIKFVRPARLVHDSGVTQLDLLVLDGSLDVALLISFQAFHIVSRPTDSPILDRSPYLPLIVASDPDCCSDKNAYQT
jgi:hypothetical protein